MTYRETDSFLLSDDEILDYKIEADDSEEEFNQILDLCQKKRLQNDKSALDDSLRPSVNVTKVFDSEYYNLPKIEDLSIHIEEDIKLRKFGIVDKFIDFIVNIKPISGVPHLDYDTILFDKDRNSVGEIFEVFGNVENTMYALRFNTEEEARLKLTEGQEVYFAPEEKLITRTVLTSELLNQKISDENDAENLAFSDDEAESSYFAKKRAKHRPSPNLPFQQITNKRFRMNNV